MGSPNLYHEFKMRPDSMVLHSIITSPFGRYSRERDLTRVWVLPCKHDKSLGESGVDGVWGE